MLQLRSRAALGGIAAALLLGILVLLPGNGHAALDDCGQPASNGTKPSASDALFILKTAVGTKSCDLCVCDVNDDTKISATDSLKTLKKAVGQAVDLVCPSCVPALAGVVLAPSAALSPASSVATSSAFSLSGLVGAAGVTVDLVSLGTDGTPQLPVLATTTTNADGSYKFEPAPAPGSQTIVRAKVGGIDMRAFVTGLDVDVDPASEFVVGAGIEAASAGPGLGALTVGEIGDLVTLLRETRIDVGSAGSVTAAVTLLDDSTAGVYHGLVGDFAGGSGPTPAVAGSFHIVELALGLQRSFTPSAGQTPSVNERTVAIHSASSDAVVGGDAAVTVGARIGRAHALVETSGSVPQQMGPALAVNAAATLGHTNVDPGIPSGTTMRASDHGSLLLQSDGGVAPGIFAAGTGIGFVSGAGAAPDLTAAGRTLSLVLRQGQGMSNSSLDATYSALQFEFDLEANSDSFNVHRAVEAIGVANSITFDGSGHMSLGAAAGTSIVLTKDGPPPVDPPAAPVVAASTADANESAVSGLTYTLSATGSLTVMSGADVVATGAVSGDTNLVILRIGDESDTSASAGYVLAVKRGSGMKNSSGQGNYRTIELSLGLQHDAVTGVADSQPDTDFRSVDGIGGLGTFSLDGAGTVSVQRSVRRNVSLREDSSVMRHNAGASDVFDADVSIDLQTESDGNGSETHTYSVASNGIVTVDQAHNGGITGYLSPDGKLFMLPTSDFSSDRGEIGILLALHEP